MKNIILIFVITICLFNCNKEYEINQAEIQKETKVKMVNLDFFNNKVNQDEQYNNLQSYFDSYTNPQSYQNRTIDSESNIIILTDEIVLVQEDEIDFYTFKVITDDESDAFFNLIVQVNNQQEIIKSEFLEYQPSTDWLTDTNRPFSGYIKLIENDFLNLNDIFSSRAGSLCVTGATGTWECYAGNNHSPSDCKDEETNPNGSCTACGAQYFITITYGRCPITISDDDSGSGSGFNFDGGDNTGGGSNSGSAGNSSTVPTRPCGGNNGLTNNIGDCFDSNDLALTEQLNDILTEGDSFILDNSLLESESMSFDSVAEFHEFLDITSFEEVGGFQNINQIGNFETIFKVNLGLTTININCNQKLKNISNNQEYELLSLNTSYNGLTIGSSWEQTSFSYTVIGNEAIITLDGLIHYNLFIDGIGTVYSEAKTYEMKINILTGEPISIVSIE